MEASGKRDVIVVGNPHSHPSALAFLNRFIRILERVPTRIIVIAGDKPSEEGFAEWVEVSSKNGTWEKRSPLTPIREQIEVARRIVNLDNNSEVAIVLPTSFLLPAILLKLKKMRIAVFVDGIPNSRVIRFLSKLNIIFADALLVESEMLLSNWGAEDLRRKCYFGMSYVDTNLFLKRRAYESRESVIAFIGRLTEEKGALDFAEALPRAIDNIKDLRAMIIGEGDQSESIKEFVSANFSDKQVQVRGWLPHDEMPDVLNQLSLLVLPSHTEGLPNTMIEAMACGTPVLATRVGAIPDVIKDGHNGFILNDSSPRSIADGIVSAMCNPNLHQISERAVRLIRDDYTLDRRTIVMKTMIDEMVK